MRKTDNGQKVNIVSFRIDDQEMKVLKKLCRQARLSVSDLLRTAILELKEQKERKRDILALDHLVQEVWPRPESSFYCYGSYVREDLADLGLDRGAVAAGDWD
ncbi:ribbon-helix-helix domain-containing protein [Geomonas sp.]|uniref:ribbon-helix-helix domain-containing protein n=1 Tax=Geomonas sp. TaxID=2651584 RepID=UPI002B4A39F1|nr:ribbon-helix-helix domain-containing protein [Geomonas sp.]HJV35091.1 ribbon-helix-helix domain-containing protein [Geomonas sp.]